MDAIIFVDPNLDANKKSDDKKGTTTYLLQ